MTKSNWKWKATAAALAAAMAAGALAGCSSGGGTSSAASSAGSTPASSAASGSSEAAGGDAAAAGDNKLVIGLQANSFITDYEDNYFTSYIEEKTGTDIEFYMLPADQTEFRTKVSLMVTSKDNMPDIVMGFGPLTPEMILDYGSKGAFIKLNDYLSDPAKAPNFNAIPQADKDEMLTAMTSADGNIYGLPKYEPETWNLAATRLYINGAWLQKVGKEVPTTTDELKDVLIAFRDGDPNGNGVQDEIGLYGYADGGYGQNTAWGIINSFVFFNGFAQNGGLAVDEAGDKVMAPFTTDGFKEGLKYLNSLYSEKVLAASMFTDDDTQFKATLNADPPVVGIVAAGSTGNWPDADNNANFQELDIIAPLKGPSGIAYTPYSPYSPGLDFFITSGCKNPDLAFKFGDAFFEDNVSKTMRFGEEGVDWSQDPADFEGYSNAYIEAGLYDSLNLLYKTNIWAENSTKFWHNVGPRYASMELGNTIGDGRKAYDPTKKTAKLNAFSYQYYYPAHPDKVLPLLKYTADEASQNSEAITNITDYVKQSVAEFTTGARNLDKDWDGYLKELENMGLSQWLQTAQAAYDRTK